LQPRSVDMVSGGQFWNELYTTDLERAQAFYGKLFGWVPQEIDNSGRTKINNLAGRFTTVFHDCKKAEHPLDKPQWIVSFAVKDIDAAVGAIADETIVWGQNAHGAAICIKDPNGAIFFVSEIVEQSGWFY